MNYHIRAFAAVVVMGLAILLIGCNDDKPKAAKEADKAATSGKFEKVIEPQVPTFGKN